MNLSLKTKHYDPDRGRARSIFETPDRYARQALPRKPWMDLVKHLREQYRIDIAVDLGCGLGVETVKLLAAGFDTYGIDGSEAMREHIFFPYDRYIVADICDQLKFDADLIWCREVAEHIPFAYSENLVRTIVRSGKVCYFTAAPPGQIGSGHINCQNQSMWLALFDKLGWGVDKDATLLNQEMHPNGIDRQNGMVLSGPQRPMLKML